MNKEITINSLSYMDEFASKIANILVQHKGVVFLDGDLGAGKTTFTQLLGKHLGIKQLITSPTFNIFKRYEFDKCALNHFDLYRIKDNVYDQGFEDYWDDPNEITIIEWSEYLPEEFQEMAIIKLYIKIIDENKRLINIEANESILKELE